MLVFSLDIPLIKRLTSYIIFLPKKILISRDIIFHEQHFPFHNTSHSSSTPFQFYLPTINHDHIFSDPFLPVSTEPTSSPPTIPTLSSPCPPSSILPEQQSPDSSLSSVPSSTPSFSHEITPTQTVYQNSQSSLLFKRLCLHCHCFFSSSLV